VFYLLSFVLGVSVGSFVQVIVTRLNVAPIIKGRSKCLSCGEALRVSDLVPLLSHVFLKGRCKYCRSPFGTESLVIEMLFGLVFVFLYATILSRTENYMEAIVYLLFYTLLFISLGIMALYDRKHTYVPMEFLALFLSLCFGMYVFGVIGEGSLERILSPLIVPLPFLLIWLVSKGKALGFGDVLLFIGVGAFFSLYQGVAVFLIAVWTGALYGLYKKYIEKDTNKAIPFVPFIVIAFLVVLFTGIDVFSIAFPFI
jgi:leader peptidase (prepilin peptidase) / N-methyltransferase